MPVETLTVADVLHELGDIPPNRVRWTPHPATIDDVIDIEAQENRLFELVDGTLVEKAMGAARESLLACALIELLRRFVRQRKLGVVLGADGTLEILTGLVRIPDVSFISKERLPGGRMPEKPIPNLVPDLAVEILSKGNTKREMSRKHDEYFRAGVRSVWEIDPKTRTATVFSLNSEPFTVRKSGVLDGDEVLPGFSLSLKEFFAELDEQYT